MVRCKACKASHESHGEAKMKDPEAESYEALMLEG